jgi:hypothetical protein
MSPGGARFVDLQMALFPTVLDCSSCSATDSAPETALKTSDIILDNAELFVTGRVIYSDKKLTLEPTTIISSLDTPVLPLVDTDAYLNTREDLPCGDFHPRICYAKTLEPIPSQMPGPGALLNPLCSLDTLTRDISSSPVVQTSSDFIYVTPPPSSPQTECNASAMESPVGDGEVHSSNNHMEMTDYPVMTMSSPNFYPHEDESLPSPSPPHQNTGSKRNQCDESDEVRCQKWSCDCI